MSHIYKPGSIAPEDGMYIKVDSEGMEINEAFEMLEGDKFPPTQEADVSYKKV